MVQSNNSLAEKDLSVDQSESNIHQEDDDLQSFSPKSNILPNPESESNASRRDTYSIDARSIVFEQNSTPTPRRSILKCSKTTKPNRSRSNSRMVQFARLPKSDSRIKMSRSRFNTVPNFVVTNDEFNEADVSQDSRNVTQFDVDEEYDDDLDGVQPLDISVSSLMNSPILDISSIHKSSKRGSRGNKVMSLISSFENRTNDSPKHSIRASDLLSMNGSTSGDTTLNNDSPRNTNVLQDSVSSPRRINLEDVFIAEDSLKNASCNIENKTTVHESSEQHTKLISGSEINVLNNTSKINVSDEVSDLSSDVSKNETEFNFASPLKIQPGTNSSKTTLTDLNQSAFVCVEKDNNSVEVIDNQSKTNISQFNSCQLTVENCNTIMDKSVILSKNSVENSFHQDNIDDISNNSSKNINSTSNENYDTINNSNNVSALLEKNKLKNKDRKSSSESFKMSISVVKDHTDVQNNVTNSTENLFILEKNRPNTPSDVSKLINEESSSMILQSISNMQKFDIDELEKTHSQHNENLDESYVLVDESDVQNASNRKTEVITENLNKSLVDSIEVQLDKIHDSNVISNEDELVSLNSSQDTNIEKTLTSSIVSEGTQVENPNTEVHVNSASKTKLSVKNNSSKNCNNIENSEISQLTDNESDNDDVHTTKNSYSLSKSNRFIDETVPSNNSLNNEREKSKLLNDSHQKTSNISNCSPNSRNLNKSKNNVSINVIKSKNTRSSQKITGEVSSHVYINQTEDSKIDKSYGGILDTSIGKPQYESTPWNGSKSSKTLSSTASNQANETSHGDVSTIADKQNKTNRSNSSKIPHLDETTQENINIRLDEQRNTRRSVTPDIEPEIWSQMMKDFNESVKKASGSNYINPVNNVEIPISHELKSEKISIKVITEDGESLNYTDSENITKESENINNLQSSKISSCSSSNNTLKTSVEHDQSRRSTRNSTRSKTTTEIPKRSLRTKSSQSKRIKLEVHTTSKIINRVISTNEKNSINTKSAISAKKRSGTTDSNNLNSDISNENSHETEKPSSLFKAVNNSAKQNNKTTSAKSDVAVSILESEHDSNSNTSLNISSRVTRNKKMTKKTHSILELPPTRRNLRGGTSSGNDTVTSTKPNVAVLTLESEHDSNADTSSNISLPVTRNKKMTKKKHSSPAPARRNLRVKVEKNESGNSNKKLTTIDVTVTDGTSSGNDTEMGSSGSANNMLPAAKRQLRKKEQNLGTEQLKPIIKDKKTLKDKKKLASNKPLKNTSNSEIKLENILNTEKSKEIQPVRTRLTRNKSTLNEASLPIFNKKTKSSSPVKTKSVKVGKMKKTTGSKLNKKSQPKNLSAKPINIKTESISSEYESLSETEEIPRKSQSDNNQPKTRKENIEKKMVQINETPSLPPRRNRKEIIETLNVSSQLSTRSRKRPADTSPFSQPNAKGVKRDISSKIANSTKSRVSNSPKESASSSTIKLTRNMSKSAVSQSSNNSFPETVKIGKKQNSSAKSIPKKRVLNSDESSTDCAPSTRKMTRFATTKETETEIKKSNASTRSKSKVQSTDTDDSEKSTK